MTEEDVLREKIKVLERSLTEGPKIARVIQVIGGVNYVLDIKNVFFDPREGLTITVDQVATNFLKR